MDVHVWTPRVYSKTFMSKTMPLLAALADPGDLEKCINIGRKTR